MIHEGILNPALAELLCRFRHTNTIVIADKGFPYWPEIQTLDLSVTVGLPTVRQILEVMRDRYSIGKAWMAEESKSANPPSVLQSYQASLGNTQIQFEPHTDFKKRVPHTIGLIRTGDATQYGNIILESA
ncbi:MAG: RbsD/FucU family protein [Verrucomicrobiota bacterium]